MPSKTSWDGLEVRHLWQPSVKGTITEAVGGLVQGVRTEYGERDLGCDQGKLLRCYSAGEVVGGSGGSAGEVVGGTRSGHRIGEGGL